MATKKKTTKKTKTRKEKKDKYVESPSFKLLNEKQKEFVYNYVKNLGNGTRAYLEAYPNSSYDAATVSAIRLLANDRIKEAIQEYYKKIWKEKDSELEKTKTYQLIHSIGESDISDVIDLEDGTLTVKNLKDIPVSARHAIQSIKRVERTTKEGIDVNLEVKMHPKLQALELRAKLQKMIEDKAELTGELIVIPAVRPDRKKEKEIEKEETEE